MLRIILPFFLLALNFTCVAQYWVGSFGINYGTYSMKSVKEFQQIMSSSVTLVPLEVVDQFPARVGPELSLLRCFGKFSLGTYFSAASTGGRASYADYSGVMNQDIIVNNRVAAIQVEGAVLKKETVEVFFSFRHGFSFNEMKFINTFQVNDLVQSEEKYESINMMISAGVGSRIFYRNFFLHPEVRYEGHIVKDDLHYPENEEIYLEVNNDKVQVGWDGVRLCLSIGYRL